MLGYLIKGGDCMKLIRKYLILIIIVAIVLLLAVGITLFLTSGMRGRIKGNHYDFGDSVIDLPGTITYKNDSLGAKHCLNDICIENATFYYNDEVGRVEYNITNTSKKKASGYLKMVFDNQSLIVIYKDLKPNKTVKSESQYMGIEIRDKNDYKLKELTKEEISKLIK